MLRQAGSGDKEALDRVMPLVYQELKRLAGAHLRSKGELTLNATALVHEAFLRLVGGAQPEYENRSHFYGIASRLMRHVIVDLVRNRRALKRGHDRTVHLEGVESLGDVRYDLFVELNDALDRLEAEHPRKAQLIEMRYFGGMTAEESAKALSITLPTVQRELRFAQAWLHRELAR